MFRARLLAPIAIMSIFALGGCGKTDAPQFEATPSAPAAPVTAEPTLDAADLAVCLTFKDDIEPISDLFSDLKAGKAYPTLIMSSIVQTAASKARTVARGASPELAGLMTRYAGTLDILKQKIDAYRTGTLDLAVESSAVGETMNAVATQCTKHLK